MTGRSPGDNAPDVVNTLFMMGETLRTTGRLAARVAACGVEDHGPLSVTSG